MCASVSSFDCRQVGVAMAEGKHLFPFRTEKLSPPAPMVLPGRPGGRVGRRPFLLREPRCLTAPGLVLCTPGMGTDWEVKVLREPGHRNPREPQGRNREGASEGSGERTCGPTNRNRIQGDADQGERAKDREALVTKGRRRRSGGRAGKVSALIRG